MLGQTSVALLSFLWLTNIPLDRQNTVCLFIRRWAGVVCTSAVMNDAALQNCVHTLVWSEVFFLLGVDAGGDLVGHTLTLQLFEGLSAVSRSLHGARSRRSCAGPRVLYVLASARCGPRVG